MTDKKTIVIPDALKETIQRGHVILFLGAGASREAKSLEGKKPPNSKELSKLLSQKFLGTDHSKHGLMQVSAMCTNEVGESIVNDFIKDTLKKFEPSSAHKLIPTFNWHSIATTNYDTLVEDAYGLTDQPVQNLIPFVKDLEPIEIRIAETNRPLVYLKLHGCIDHAHDKQIPLILEASHYEQYKTNRERLFDRLADYGRDLPILFIGYQLSDSHISNIIHRLDRIGSRPRYYIVSPDLPDEVKKLWQSKRVEPIDGTFKHFMEELDSAIPEMWRKLNISSISAEDPLRFHFRKNLEPSETLSNSLRADLTHIHPTVPVEELKPQNFYRGYDKGFSAVSSNFDVSRDVTSDLILDLIDTQNVIGGSFHLLRGPAGSGKTIALKRIAWDVAADFEGVVFWIEETGILKANVVNEICELLGKKVYLIIDKASTRLEEIISVLTEARIKKLPVSIIAAERDHIWNIESGDFDQNWKTKSFQIGQLRPTEIKELLGKLKKYSALGVLSHLNFIEQQEAFNNADRHLLVALHEVTLGKAFEEIILDEYEGLKPDKAKRLYLDICTLNQFGAPVRAGIINRITSIPFSMFRKEFILPLDNVVLTSENRYTGDMQYSARHSRIASLVFKLAFSKDEQRVEHLVRLGSCLDEGFKADRFALSELINARNLCALISDIECGRSLYDQFRDLLGDRWYLFHQRANFELQHKNGSFDEAETYGQLALELEPERSSILHVLAEVSRARAKKEDNVNRKNIYRQQARDRVSNMHGDRSKFADSTRCKLRLDEMRDSLKELAEEDIQSIENFSVRTNLAREILDKAKYKYPTDPDIIRLEADFYSMLREDSKAIRALERAYQLKKSNGPNIPLQLTRMYHKSGDIEKAREVLENEIANSPNNTSLNYELAKHIIEYDEIIAKAVYYIGRSYNSSDRNYTARFLHAQLTFLLGDSEKSKELFQEVDQIAPFDFKQKNKAGNPSKISRKLGRLQGRIIKIEKTYCFVKCSKYPNNIYANRVDSNYDNWGSLNPSKSITFEVRFNRSGPIAVDICC